MKRGKDGELEFACVIYKNAVGLSLEWLQALESQRKGVTKDYCIHCF